MLAHPSSLPRRSASVSTNSDPRIVISPARSSRFASGSPMFTIREMATTSVTIPTGTLRKKIQRQPSVSVSAPPTSDPMATAIPTVALQAAIAFPRSAPRNSWPISASPVANIAAPPMPCSARAAIRSAVLFAAPHSTDAEVDARTPATNMVLRPNRSASDPHVRMRAASARARRRSPIAGL